MRDDQDHGPIQPGRAGDFGQVLAQGHDLPGLAASRRGGHRHGGWRPSIRMICSSAPATSVVTEKICLGAFAKAMAMTAAVVAGSGAIVANGGGGNGLHLLDILA